MPMILELLRGRQEEKLLKVTRSHVKSLKSSWSTNKLNCKISWLKQQRFVSCPLGITSAWSQMPSTSYWTHGNVPVTTLKMLITWSSGKDWWVLGWQPHVLFWKGQIGLTLIGQNSWHDSTNCKWSRKSSFTSRRGQKCLAYNWLNSYHRYHQASFSALGAFVSVTHSFFKLLNSKVVISKSEASRRWLDAEG